MKNIGLIGCGNIAETYFRAQEYFNNMAYFLMDEGYTWEAVELLDQFKLIEKESL